MELEFIRDRLNSRKGQALEITHHYAVLLPLIEVNGEWHILYEVRSSALETQPGEVSFPGGRVEDGESPLQAALRETCEELGIAPEQIEYAGELDFIASPYNFMLHAYAGILRNVSQSAIRFSADEVERVVAVPLSFFLRTVPEKYMGEVDIHFAEDFPYHLIPNGTAYRWRKGQYPVYFYIYGEIVIWGITARLTLNFVGILEKGT